MMRMLTDEWTHVFVIPLPDPDNLTYREVPMTEFACAHTKTNISDPSCDSLKSLLQSLRMLHVTSIQRIRSIIDHMYANAMLPENYVGRHERGLFDLGGEISNSLFGVATDKQLRAIRDTGIHATSNNATAFEAWQQHADQLSSFMTITNQRLDNLADIIQTQQHMVT